jgi:PHD/YefM family antitoxin component YafN of YafNO toxin-antitoxin module
VRAVSNAGSNIHPVTLIGDRTKVTVKRIELGQETDLRDVVEQVWEDKIPRLIERDGEPLAMVVSPEDFDTTYEPKSRRLKERLLSLAGVWSDLDADRMIEELYRRRHEPPPSPPVEV